MAETFVYGNVKASNSQNPFISVSGQGIANGDKGVLFLAFANSGGQVINTPPAGWTQMDTLVDDSGNIAGVFYHRDMDGTEGTIQWALSLASKVVMGVWVGRGMTAGTPAGHAMGVEGNTSVATHTAPTVSAAQAAWRLTFIADKSSTPATAWTQPSGDAKRGEDFNAGGGSTTGFLSDSGAKVSPSGGSISGGSGTATNAGGNELSNNAIMATVLVVPVASGSGVQVTAADCDASMNVPAVLGDRQAGHPASDITTSGWTGTPTVSPQAANIDETVASDADYIRSQDNPVAQVGEWKFGALSNPNQDGNHVLAYRLLSEISTLPCTVQLVQGTTVIATFTPRNATVAGVTYRDVISQAQAAAINDYTDLRIRVTANG